MDARESRRPRRPEPAPPLSSVLARPRRRPARLSPWSIFSKETRPAFLGILCCDRLGDLGILAQEGLRVLPDPGAIPLAVRRRTSAPDLVDHAGPWDPEIEQFAHLRDGPRPYMIYEFDETPATAGPSCFFDHLHPGLVPGPPTSRSIDRAQSRRDVQADGRRRTSARLPTGGRLRGCRNIQRRSSGGIWLMNTTSVFDPGNRGRSASARPGSYSRACSRAGSRPFSPSSSARGTSRRETESITSTSIAPRTDPGSRANSCACSRPRRAGRSATSSILTAELCAHRSGRGACSASMKGKVPPFFWAFPPPTCSASVVLARLSGP